MSDIKGEFVVTKIPLGQNPIRFKRKIEAGPFLYTAIKNFFSVYNHAEGNALGKAINELKLALRRANESGFSLDNEARNSIPNNYPEEN